VTHELVVDHPATGAIDPLEPFASSVFRTRPVRVPSSCSKAK
jgi:hypothetical protein